MRFATLISWLLTASMGGFMLRTWLARGGLRLERARVVDCRRSSYSAMPG